MANFFINAQDPKGGQHRFECDPTNTELYIHHPRFADVDHVFHRFDQTDRRLGAFIWRSVLGDEKFGEIANFMRDCGEYELHYRPQPTDADMEQYEHFEGQDLDRLLDDTDEDDV